MYQTQSNNLSYNVSSVDDINNLITRQFGDIDAIVDEINRKDDEIMYKEDNDEYETNEEKQIEQKVNKMLNMSKNYLSEGLPDNTIFPVRCPNCFSVLGNKAKVIDEELKKGKTVREALQISGVYGKKYSKGIVSPSHMCCAMQIMSNIQKNEYMNYQKPDWRQVPRTISTSTLQHIPQRKNKPREIEPIMKKDDTLQKTINDLEKLSLM